MTKKDIKSKATLPDVHNVKGFQIDKIATEDGIETITTETSDVLRISTSHRKRAELLFRTITEIESTIDKLIIAVGGPSGSGKSEIGALLSTMFHDSGYKSMLIPCDNYPIRPPLINDAYRRELFDKHSIDQLENFLGSEQEILFFRLADIVKAFKSGKAEVNLRKIDMSSGDVIDKIPTPINGAKILIFEGTWACKVAGVDYAIYLDTTYQETENHRLARNRDEIKNLENRAFIDQYVLPLEQKKLEYIKAELAHYWLAYSQESGASMVRCKKYR